MILNMRGVALCMTLLIAAVGSAPAHAQSQALIDKVKSVIDADTPRLEATFKDLHANPELASPRLAPRASSRLNSGSLATR